MINTIFMAAEVLTGAQMASKTGALIGVALAAAFIAASVSYGISKVGSKGVEAMARQPEVADKISSAMFLPCSLIEGVGFLTGIILVLVALVKL